MMQARRIGIATAVIIVLMTAVALVILPSRTSPSIQQSTPPVSAADTATEAHADPKPAPVEYASDLEVGNATDATRTPALPASLQGTTADGEVTLDANGSVVATLGLRRLFDYFLSTIGELDVPAIRALLLAHVRRLHGELVADEVGRIFDRYVDYQRALSDAEPGLSSDLDARLAFAKQLRRKFFDAASADAYFGEEEAYAEYTLERMRIARDAGLDENARAARLLELEQTLSAEQRASLQQATTAVLAEEQTRQFDAIHASPEERHAERSALYGEEAANRLADLDRQRNEWDQRIAAYRQARNAIQADPGYSAAQREHLIGELRARSFDGNEARRVAALESIGKL
jgi:lipase chaperone LimK